MTAVLVTGAAGFVGRHVVTALTAAAHSVVAVDLRRTPPETGAAEVIEADFATDRVLAQVRSGRFAAVVHQAAISSTLEDDWQRLLHSNVEGPMELARACAAAGTPLLYASSSAVYGRIHRRAPMTEDALDDPAACTGPLNAYGRSKLLFDTMLAQAAPPGLRWVGLRYTNVFGSGEQDKGAMASILSQLLRSVAAGRPPTLYADTLEASRDYVPVSWVTEVIRALVDTLVPNGVYNVGSGAPVSFATLLNWCWQFSGAEQLGVSLVPNPLPDRYQYWTCADVGKLRAVLALPELDVQEVRRAAQQLYREEAGELSPAG